MKSPKSKENPWRAFALVNAIGAELVVCMAAGYFAGSYVSKRTGDHPIWIVVGIMAGFIVGVISIIYLLRFYMGGKNE